MADSAPTPASATLEADLSGRQLGDYRILRRLGRGGMAEVYLAEQTSLRRSVAIKVLKSSLATDDKYVRRFHVEAQAAASLVHASIVQIHEVGCVDGVHYIAQEYVQGRNLRELLSRDGPPELKVAVKVMRSVAAALDRAAEKGIVHRDIKPENIMLSRGGEVKVADFGLARHTREDALHLTQVGQTMGTPLYMSPEQVEGKPLDPRSDIYSLGVTCYHMLTGNPPFRGETALNVAVQHLKNQPDRLENQRPDLPTALCRIVHKMLAKDPAHRHASARELLRELRALKLEVEGEDDEAAWEELDLATVSGLGRSLATERLDSLMKTAAVSRPRRRRTWLWAAAVLLAFVAGSAAAWALRPPFLLAEATGRTSPIKQQPTAAAQTLYADLAKTEEAWKAVLEYYPNDPYFAPQARRELAMMYLKRSGAEEEALTQFNYLAALDADTDAEFRAIGLAGQAIVLSLKKQHEKSAEKLAELMPVLDKLDPRTRQIVDDVKRENDRALNRKTEAEWDDLLRRLEGG